MAKKSNKKREPIKNDPTVESVTEGGDADKAHEESQEDFVIVQEESVSVEEESPQVDETPIVKEYTPDVKYREVIYLGVADICKRFGAVTGNRYNFTKDSYGMPTATHVDEKDYPALISERGRGCARRDPSLLFMSKSEWDLEIEQARIANNS